MRRFASLLVLAFLIAACDRGVSNPPDEPLALMVTVSGNAGETIGAVLLSVAGSPDRVVVPAGWIFTTPDADSTLVAAVLAVGGTGLEMELDLVAAEPPAIRVLQVADADNQLFPDPAAFAVSVEDREVVQ